jgi:hypothetical protein
MAMALARRIKIIPFYPAGSVLSRRGYAFGRVALSITNESTRKGAVLSPERLAADRVGLI